MELKFGSPKQAVHNIPNQPVHAEKLMASEDIRLWLIDANFTHLWFFATSL